MTNDTPTTTTSLPLDFPPLLALAEANVRANWPIEERTRTRFGYDPRGDTLDDYCAEIRAFFIGCEADRLRDLTRRDSQAAWLGWLAREVGVREPEVGCPAWIGVRAKILYLRTFVDAEPANRADLGAVASCAYFVFGSLDWADSALIQGVVKDGISVVYCPALDNPDAPDAPIRALMQAVLTVGSRGGA